MVRKKQCKRFYGAKKPLKIWNVDVGNIVISKLVQTKNNSKYFIEYLDQFIRPLMLILPKMSGNFKIFKEKVWDEDENNKLILCV